MCGRGPRSHSGLDPENTRVADKFQFSILLAVIGPLDGTEYKYNRTGVAIQLQTDRLVRELERTKPSGGWNCRRGDDESSVSGCCDYDATSASFIYKGLRDLGEGERAIESDGSIAPRSKGVTQVKSAFLDRKCLILLLLLVESHPQ